LGWSYHTKSLVIDSGVLGDQAMLQIQLLGSFQLLYDGALLTTVNQARQQALLAYLLLHRHAPQPRQHVAFRLWPDSSEAQAKTNLRRELYHLRRLLPAAEQFLAVDSISVRWRSEAPFTLDVADFERLLAEAERMKSVDRPAETITALEQALALYHGPLLPSCYDDWILPLREGLDQHSVTALEQLVVLLEEQREYAAAMHQAERLLRHDPLHETTYRRLMRLAVLGGDRARALRIYQDCAARLQQELGVEPSPETQALYESLLQAEPQALPEPARQRMWRAEERTALVGRQREWQTLLTAWRSTQCGHAQVVLIAGEAGIGKTRLAEELLVWASRQNHLTARSRAYAMEGSLAYTLITELLRNEALAARWSTLPEVWLLELARLLPEVLDQHPKLPPPTPLTESWQRQRFFEGLARAVLAGPEPRLLLLDDLQWCDQETLAWVRYLLRFAAGARLLVVGTARSEEITVEHPLTSLRLDLQREDQWIEIELAALTNEETAMLAAQTAGRPLSAGEADQIYQATEGNPLFVVETVRAGLIASVQRWAAGQSDAQPLDLTGKAMPPKVYAVIQSRLAQLSPLARELAQVAATIGRSFHYDLLVEVSNQGEADLVRLLDELWQRRVLVVHAAHLYDFSHDRIREAIYAQIGPTQRTHLHRCIAQALERLAGEHLDAVAAQIAAHYEQAGLAEKAILWYKRAADVHRRLYAHSEVLANMNAALVLLRRQPATHNRDQQELSLLFFLSNDLVIAKGFSAAVVRPVLEQACDLAARLNERRHLFYVVRALLMYHIARRGLLVAQELALQLLSLAQAMNDRVCLAEANRCLARVHGHRGEFALAYMYVKKAIDRYMDSPVVASPFDGEDFRWNYYANASLFLWVLGQVDQARTHMDRALALTATGVRPYSLANVSIYAAMVYRNLGNCQQVAVIAQQMVMLGDKHDLLIARINGKTFQGWVRAQQGDLAGGIAQIAQALAELRDLVFTMHITYRLALLAELYIQAGQFDKAGAVLEEARTISEQCHERFWDVEVHRLQGELLLAQDADPTAVERCYRRALEIAHMQQAKSLELRVVMSMARLWVRHGRSDEARQLLAETYGWFREGFDTADLGAARLLLDQLSSPEA
jgi:DNA-binding SARP family transcriptional activator